MAEFSLHLGSNFEVLGERDPKLTQEIFLFRTGFGDPMQAQLTPVGRGKTMSALCSVESSAKARADILARQKEQGWGAQGH